jgi:hypothetical protein
VNGVGRAFAAGEECRAGAGREHHAIVVADDLVHCQRNRGIGKIRDHVHAFVLDPSPGDGGAEVGLVLMIGGNDLDLAAGGLAAMVLDCELCGEDRARSLIIGIDPGHVVHHPNAHHAAGLRQCLTA